MLNPLKSNKTSILCMLAAVALACVGATISSPAREGRGPNSSSDLEAQLIAAEEKIAELKEYHRATLDFLTNEPHAQGYYQSPGQITAEVFMRSSTALEFSFEDRSTLNRVLREEHFTAIPSKKDLPTLVREGARYNAALHALVNDRSLTDEQFHVIEFEWQKIVATIRGYW